MDTSFTIIFLLPFRSLGLLLWSLVPCVDYYVVYLLFSIDSKRPETAAKSNILRNEELVFYLFLHWFLSFALYSGTYGIDCPLHFCTLALSCKSQHNTIIKYATKGTTFCNGNDRGQTEHADYYSKPSYYCFPKALLLLRHLNSVRPNPRQRSRSDDDAS